MRDLIRKWLGLDELATKEDIREISRLAQLRTVNSLKPYKLETRPEPISFEQMQAQALEQSNEDAA